jgi:hypothetical protein
MDYPALLSAIEAKLREMQARCEAAQPDIAEPLRSSVWMDLPALVGWALAIWRAAKEYRDHPEFGLFTKIEMESLARALGLHGEKE